MLRSVKVDRENQRARIVGAAIRLAEEHGFEGVGLRDVADEVGMALGTLYKSFRNKDEILSAVVERRISHMRSAMSDAIDVDGTPVDRVVAFFEKFTEVVARHPAFARAILSALSSRRSQIVKSILRSDVETTRMIIAAIRGVNADEVELDDATEDEREVAFLLRQLWFASMVGWSNELHTLETWSSTSAWARSASWAERADQSTSLQLHSELPGTSELVDEVAGRHGHDRHRHRRAAAPPGDAEAALGAAAGRARTADHLQLLAVDGAADADALPAPAGRLADQVRGRRSVGGGGVGPARADRPRLLGALVERLGLRLRLGSRLGLGLRLRDGLPRSPACWLLRRRIRGGTAARWRGSTLSWRADYQLPGRRGSDSQRAPGRANA